LTRRSVFRHVPHSVRPRGPSKQQRLATAGEGDEHRDEQTAVPADGGRTVGRAARGLYRDEVYDEDSPDKGVAEIIVAKQRNGPIGHVRLAFRGQFTRFENLASDACVSAAGDMG
jgi:hypothetical protein